ncbi:MAG: hypothetical protein ACTSYX_02605 [Candidatus Thorarchaeota archaeon]
MVRNPDSHNVTVGMFEVIVIHLVLGILRIARSLLEGANINHDWKVRAIRSREPDAPGITRFHRRVPFVRS